MPDIYLSPSHRESNTFIIGGNEEYYMNLIADAMIPYLRASKIDFTRNDPEITLTQVIRQSNARNYDLHLAIGSNMSPDTMRGFLQGPDVYYYTASRAGKKAAAVIAGQLKEIYPNPELITTIPTTSVAEVRRTKAPAILVEIGYLDNYEDAAWIRDNIDKIGAALTRSVAEYLEVPFVNPYE